jgi:MYXO-CTERM domain-containing protein
VGFVESANVTVGLDCSGSACAQNGMATDRGGFAFGLDGVTLAAGTHTLTWQVVPTKGGTALATATVSFTVAAPTATPPTTGADWPAFHGGPDHAGNAPDMLDPPLTLAWASAIGGYSNVASPVVKDGMVFQAVMDFDGGSASGVVALDGVTGKQLWFYPTADPAEATLTVAGDLVIVTTQNGTITALDEASGKPQWMVTPPVGAASMKNPDDVYLYSGAVADGPNVFVGATPWFVSLDLTTGNTHWLVPTQWQWLMTYSTPATANGLVVAAFGRGVGPDGLTAYSETDGSVVWPTAAKPLPCDFTGIDASPVIADSVVYATTGDGHLCALNLADGSAVWPAQAIVPSGNAWTYDLPSTPTIGPDQIYIATGSGTVDALDRTNGHVRWSFTEPNMALANLSPFRSSSKTIVSSPALAGEELYVAGNDGYLYALAAHDGNKGCDPQPEKGGCVLWSTNLGAPTNASPAISGNFLYLSTLAGVVYAFSGATSPLGPVPPEPTPPGCACTVGGVHRGAPVAGVVALAGIALAIAWRKRSRARRAR